MSEILDESRLTCLARVAFLALLEAGSCAAAGAADEISWIGAAGNFCISPAIGTEAASAGDGRLYPRWGPEFGIDCDKRTPPLRLGVTHENAQNSHAGAKNDNPNVVAYMADFDFDRDFGRWVRAGVRREDGENVFTLGLDTINYNEVNRKTGWPLRYGHLFVGLNDVTAIFALNSNVKVEFDLRIAKKSVAGVPGLAYSGRRVFFGAVASWDEAPPRTNKSHHFEANLLISHGYSLTYNEKSRPDCHGVGYDRCFYDEKGRYAEGREVSYQRMFHRPDLPSDPSAWTHVSIPIAASYRSLLWASRPQDWAKAKVTGIYFGLESVGATNTEIEIKNYRVLKVQ